MVNTSAPDMNSTSVPLDVLCVRDIYVGALLLYVLKSLCFCLGTPAHSWMLWLCVRDGWKIKAYQVFLLNLTVLELIYCIQCGVNIVYTFLFTNDTFMAVMCFLLRLSWAGRSLMYVCMSVEQYVAVLHPIIFLKYKDVQYRVAAAAAAWLMTTAYASFQILESPYPDISFNVVFFIAMSVISFFCVSVLRELKLPRPGDTQQITTERGRDVGNQQKRNAFKTIFTGLLIILLIYLPQVSLTLFYMMKIDKKLLFCSIFPILSSFCTLGVIVTPFPRMYKEGHLKCLKQSREN